MKNLEQLRAAHALKNCGQLNRSGVSKLPSLILSNGLLATAAFCEAAGATDNRSVMKNALEATAKYLVERQLTAPGKSTQEVTIKDLISSLANANSCNLQRATAEALAYIGYLKRFAPNKD